MRNDLQSFMESLDFLNNEAFKPFAPAIAEAFRAGYEMGMLKGFIQRDTYDHVVKLYKGED